MNEFGGGGGEATRADGGGGGETAREGGGGAGRVSSDKLELLYYILNVYVLNV